MADQTVKADQGTKGSSLRLDEQYMLERKDELIASVETFNKVHPLILEVEAALMVAKQHGFLCEMEGMKYDS